MLGFYFMLLTYVEEPLSSFEDVLIYDMMYVFYVVETYFRRDLILYDEILLWVEMLKSNTIICFPLIVELLH